MVNLKKEHQKEEIIAYIKKIINFFEKELIKYMKSNE
jgi:hypothetical protein